MKDFVVLLNQIRCFLHYLKIININEIVYSKNNFKFFDNLDSNFYNENIMKSKKMMNLRINTSTCRKCDLYTSRKNIVFGEGNPNAKLVFIGEAPGAEEDITGRPFVGAAGRLLTNIIKAMGFNREDVYICNIVKCRPPGNRNPNDLEAKKCIPFLREQIKFISPKVICLLGAVALRFFLDLKVPISKLRGKVIDYSGVHTIKIIPTYHPAYLLRYPSKKKDVWDDVQKIMKILK